MADDRFRRSLKPGELLFHEGELGHEAYVVEQGAVEIFQDRPSGRKVIARLGKNAIFGEMALVGDQTRTAAALATEPTTLTVITHDYLSERLADADPLLRHLLRVTMARSRESLRMLRGAPPEAVHEAESREDAQAGEADRDVALKRVRLEQDLERALANNEFTLFFQPIVRLADDSVAGFEALIRWIRPGVGRVPPDEFVWVAEESDLIIEIGHWIIANSVRALRFLGRVHATAHPEQPPLSMSVNLSIRQFGDPELFPFVQRALEDEKIEPRRLRLEITESLLMSNMDAVIALLHRCKALGTKLVIDDFGTGYSALSYLHKLPVDTLKLDKSFIHDAAGDGAGMKIVRAMAGLAGELGMETVMEGLETAEQALACQLAGVTYGQGYLYAKPLAMEEAVALLKRVRVREVA